MKSGNKNLRKEAHSAIGRPCKNDQLHIVSSVEEPNPDKKKIPCLIPPKKWPKNKQKKGTPKNYQ